MQTDTASDTPSPYTTDEMRRIEGVARIVKVARERNEKAPGAANTEGGVPDGGATHIIAK